MAAYKEEILIFENGERYPVLTSEGMPHFYVTLWITSKIRPTGATVNTISNKLNDLKWFLAWEEKEQRNLYAEFQQGRFLSDVDIEKIRNYLAININQQKHINKKNTKGRNKVLNIIAAPMLTDVIPTVSRHHHYNRMTSVISYLMFLAGLAVNHLGNPEFKRSIDSMEARFKASRPAIKSHGENNKDSINLPAGLIEEFISVAHYDHPQNPFSQPVIRFRNHLMFHLLGKYGVRRGELLSLVLTDMKLFGEEKSIWVRRTHDDKYDPRKNQPVAKTKERMLKISNETAELLDSYIKEYRSKTPNAKKHPYLFVTHRKCATQGKPISISTFDNTIVPIMKSVDEKFRLIHPHIFRHDWNEGYSIKVDSNNELAALGVEGYEHIDSGAEAKMRMQQMGHSSEASGVVYNQRHIAKKANEIALMEQDELNRKVTEARRELKNKEGGHE